MIPDTGYEILDSGCEILDSGCEILDSGCEMLDICLLSVRPSALCQRLTFSTLATITPVNLPLPAGRLYTVIRKLSILNYQLPSASGHRIIKTAGTGRCPSLSDG